MKYFDLTTNEEKCGWCTQTTEKCGIELPFKSDVTNLYPICTREKGHTGKHIHCGDQFHCIVQWRILFHDGIKQKVYL